MNPLDLIEAIGEMDEEWIRLCRDDDRKPDAVPEHKEICMTPSQKKPEPAEETPRYTNNPPGSALWSYLMTAGCTAACIAGMALLIHPFVRPDYPDDATVQSNTQNIAITELTGAQSEAALTGTTAVTQADIAEQAVTHTTAAVSTAASTAQTASAEQTSAAAATTAATTAATAAGTRNPAAATYTTVTTTARTETPARRTTGTEPAAATRRTTATTFTTTVTTTTTTQPLPPLPEIVAQYCRTLADGQPLWAEYRELSHHDGLDYRPQSVSGDRLQNDEPFELEGMFIEIGCAQGAPGDTVTVPVYISGVPDLIGAVMFIDPPAGLEPAAITSPLKEDLVLWHHIPERTDYDDEEYSPYSCYPAVGSFVYADVSNIQPPDGYILAYYSYKIPEDAQPGTVYPLSINAEKTEFSAYFAEEPNYDRDPDIEMTSEELLAAVLGLDGSFRHYQYTLLSGAIVVE